MEEFYQGIFQGIILAIVGFLLGLAGDAIKKAESYRKKRLVYSVKKTTIVASDKELPKLVHTRISDNQHFNIFKFQLTVQNIGETEVSDIDVYIKSNEGAEIIDNIISTNPPGLVKYSKINTGESNSTRIDNINLRTKQSIFLDSYVECEKDPTLNIYWSHDDDVEVLEGSVEGIRSLQEILIGIIRNFIFGSVSPGLSIGIFYFLSSSVILLNRVFQYILMDQNDYETPELINNTQLAFIYLGTLIGYLIAAFFYLRIIPYSLDLFRKVVKCEKYDNNLEKNLIGIIRNFILASVSRGFIAAAFNFLVSLMTILFELQSKMTSNNTQYLMDSSTLNFTISLSILIGNLVALYFYLRIIPYGTNFVRGLTNYKFTTINS